MLTFGITGAKKKKSTKKRYEPPTVASLMYHYATPVKKKKTKAKVGPDGLTAAQRARKTAGKWKTYGTPKQSRCTTAGRAVRKGKSGAGSKLASCRVRSIKK